jgi:hypothetical protein
VPLHLFLLVCRRRPVVAPQRRQAKGAVAHELDDVDGGPEAAQVVEVLAEAVPGDGRLASDSADPIAHRLFAARRNRAGREAAHADDLGRDPLAHLGLGARTLVVDEVGMRVDVDEARSDHQALGVDDPRGLTGEMGPDGGDPVALERHVGGHARGAASVDDGAVPDEK